MYIGFCTKLNFLEDEYAITQNIGFLLSRVGRLCRYLVLRPWPQQLDLWVRVGGTPFPHIHTYILQDQASPWCTQLQILDLPVLELNSLNFDFFFDFSSAKKGAFHQIVKKSRNLPYKNVFVFLTARPPENGTSCQDIRFFKNFFRN